MGMTTSFGGVTIETGISVVTTPAHVRAKFDEELMYCLKVATDSKEYRTEFDEYAKRVYFLIGNVEYDKVRENLEATMRVSTMFNVFRIGMNDILANPALGTNIKEAMKRAMTTENAVRLLKSFEDMNRKRFLLVNVLYDGLEILAVPADDHEVELPEVQFDILKVREWFENNESLAELLKVATDSEEYRCMAEMIYDKFKLAFEDVGLARLNETRFEEEVLSSLKDMVIYDAMTAAAQRVADDPEEDDLFSALHYTISKEGAIASLKYVEEGLKAEQITHALGNIAALAMFLDATEGDLF